MSQMVDFCTWDAIKGAESGRGLARSSVGAHGPCLMINWIGSPICTKVFCREDMIYALRRGQDTLGNIGCDLFVVS